MSIPEISILPAFLRQHVEKRYAGLTEPRGKNCCIGAVKPKRRRSVGGEQDQPPRAGSRENAAGQTGPGGRLDLSRWRRLPPGRRLALDRWSDLGINVLRTIDSQLPGPHEPKRSGVPRTWQKSRMA